MSCVYQTAEKVIIWLGTSTYKIDQLFQWMCRLDQEILTVPSPHTKLGVEIWEHHWICLLWRSNERSPPDDIVNTLKEILQREWFSRIWVLQETALARSAVVTCGRNSVNSRTFVAMPTILKIECSENEQSRLDVMPGPLRSNAESWWLGPFSQDLETLLRRFGNSKATDPRDVIYALLGLSTDASANLPPDYELSIEGTVQHTMLYLLHRRKYLEDFWDSADLPAWGINQLLVALDDLPQHVFTWAVDQKKDTLTNSFISSGKDTKTLQLMDDFIRGYHGPSCDTHFKSIRSSCVDLMIKHRERYTLRNDFLGPLFSGSSISLQLLRLATSGSSQAGMAQESPLSQSNEGDVDLGQMDRVLVIVCVPKREDSATVDVILKPEGSHMPYLDTDGHTSPATSDRKGAQALTVLLDRSSKTRVWEWDRGDWKFLYEGLPYILRVVLSEIATRVQA